MYAMHTFHLSLYLPEGALLRTLLGSGKGTGAAALFLVIAGAGVLVCLAFRRDRRLWELEE